MKFFLSTFLMEFHRPKDKDTVAQILESINFNIVLDRTRWNQSLLKKPVVIHGDGSLVCSIECGVTA